MKKIIATLLPILSIALLAGCTTTQTTSNANTAAENTNNTNAVAETSNSNDNVNVENTNEVTASDVDLSTEASAEVDTSDWLTYTNEEYGFSFKYPTTLYINDKSSIQSEGSYKLLLTLGETQNPNDEDFGVDVRQIDLIGRYDSVIKAINSDSNQEIISEVSGNSISKTITTRNKTSNQTKIQTLTESNGNVISFTCAEWSDKEICSQIISTLQLL